MYTGVRGSHKWLYTRILIAAFVNATCNGPLGALHRLGLISTDISIASDLSVQYVLEFAYTVIMP